MNMTTINIARICWSFVCFKCYHLCLILPSIRWGYKLLMGVARRWTQAAHLTSAAEDHNCLYSQTWFYVCFCLGNCSFHTSVLCPRCRHRTHSLVVKWSAYTCSFYMKLLSSISNLQAHDTVWWQSKPGYYWHFFNDMSGRARGSAVAV